MDYREPISEPGLRRRDWWIAAVLGAVTIVQLIATNPQIGLTWDEPIYTVAQQSYVGWFAQLAAAPSAALSDAGIRNAWEVNHEHPPLAKLWNGVFWRLGHSWLDPLLAHRLGSMLLVGILVALLYATVTPSYGRAAGLAAAASLLSMPRFFFHAHLAALDVPAAVSYVAVITLFWHTRHVQGLRRSLAVGLLLALAWGGALAFKINAAFALPVLALWVVGAERRWDHVVRLAVMSLLGPLVFVALWPWLYHATTARLADYLLFLTSKHWEIPQWYFGANYMPPPWHFPFVMFVLVVPFTSLVCALLGVTRAWRQPRAGHPIALWLLAALAPLGSLTTGKSMVYDNERLFMASFPYVAMLAGCGLTWALGMLQTRRLFVSAAITVAFLPQLANAAMVYPHLLSYYSETVGGLPGARRLGMESTYWCETYAEALHYVNANARPGAVVWVEGWSHDVLIWYQQHGQLRPDLRIALTPGAVSQLPNGDRSTVEADRWEADYVLQQYRQSGMDADWTRFRDEHTPVASVSRQGVVLIEIFERR
ncbi:MAG TPA: glycosyltransferase family 39 protein [Roseiflexaceae bacterium]|nr:glycosyltransferase family 39 protein [Roseiflexaceae bacterium]